MRNMHLGQRQFHDEGDTEHWTFSWVMICDYDKIENEMVRNKLK